MGSRVLKSPARHPKYSREEIIDLLSIEDQNEINQLFSYANSIRKKFCGDEVHLRGIIEYSNYCNRNCIYCGLRKANKTLKRYRMTLDEIIQASNSLVECGIKTVVLHKVLVKQCAFLSHINIAAMVQSHLRDKFGRIAHIVHSHFQQTLMPDDLHQQPGRYRDIARHTTYTMCSV